MLSLKQLFAQKKGLNSDLSTIGSLTSSDISISLVSLHRYKVISPITETLICEGTDSLVHPFG